jgi:hypothetical protein
MGKRNMNLRKAVLDFANEIKEFDSKNPRWLASDVIKDLNSESTKRRLEIL